MRDRWSLRAWRIVTEQQVVDSAYDCMIQVLPRGLRERWLPFGQNHVVHRPDVFGVICTAPREPGLQLLRRHLTGARSFGDDLPCLGAQDAEPIATARPKSYRFVYRDFLRACLVLA